jgi:hypothetical protein
LWWLAALPMFLLPACAPRKDQAPGGPAGSRPAPGAAATLQPKKEISLNPQQPAPARAAPLPVTTEQILPALPSPPLLPKDFDLGPLADRIGASRDERQAAAAAERFLDGLASGKVPADELAPELREELSASLAYYLDQGLRPVWHRLGTLTLENGAEGGRAAVVKVRLRGNPGSSSGELYLSLREGRWYVSDVQLGLVLLGQPEAARKEEKFIPSGYRGRLD